MKTLPSGGRSPTIGLLLGLVVTLGCIFAYSQYIALQISALRELQNNLVDRNRKDTLQLLRIQNDLNLLALAMRDMLDNEEPYPLTAWSEQFARVRADLDDALRREQQYAPVNRSRDQQQYLESSLSQFWDAADRTFALAQGGHPDEARTQVRISLRSRQEALSTAVSRLLVANNESEDLATQQIGQIYSRVQQRAYVFLVVTLVAILVTSSYVIFWTRRLFAHLAVVSAQRGELAQKLIATQESTLRQVSRELHDEFGQILTAAGMVLARAGKQLPEGSSVRTELRELSEITQGALDKVRSLSQALHPVMLEETGLESTLDWYLPVLERQSGVRIFYEKPAGGFPIDGNSAVHIYRIVQESLNNIVRHSGATECWVRLRFEPQSLEIEVEDHGGGFEGRSAQPGIGLVAMRERAQLLGGRIEFVRPAKGGTLVRLTVPREKLEAHGR
ncbi:MAG TPA: ATP-binding protein [Terriglobales bacterium]|nr:ATP-binding protein [Terriglobales bacterium]